MSDSPDQGCSDQEGDSDGMPLRKGSLRGWAPAPVWVPEATARSDLPAEELYGPTMPSPRGTGHGNGRLTSKLASPAALLRRTRLGTPSVPQKVTGD